MKINSGGQYSDRSTVGTNPLSGLLTQRPTALPYTGWIIKGKRLVMAICHLETTGKSTRFIPIRGSLSTRKRESGGLIMPKAKRNRYLVQQHDVFFPQPWFMKYRGVRPSELPRRIERTDVHIVLPILTLQQLSLGVIKKCLTRDSQAFLLDIPRSLQLELFTMLPRKPRSSS